MESMRRRSVLFAALAAAGLALGAFAQDGKKPKDPKDGKKPQDEKPAAKPDEKPDYELADDVKKLPAKDLRALGNAKQRYFLIGPHETQRPPQAGYALVLVMPGGPGEANMTNFVRNVWNNCCPQDFVFAQLVSVKWSSADVTWPTRYSKVPNMEFTTEEFVDAVLADVTKTQKLKIDPARTYQWGWSSGGPAEYAISLQEKSPVTASYVAMSVFNVTGELEPDLKNAKGSAYFLDHSPEDVRCKFEYAQKAQERLKKEGAAVELVTYKGGHGWMGDPFTRLTAGFAWMEKNHGKPERPERPERK
jgi:predicted esterase